MNKIMLSLICFALLAGMLTNFSRSNLSNRLGNNFSKTTEKENSFPPNSFCDEVIPDLYRFSSSSHNFNNLLPIQTVKIINDEISYGIRIRNIFAGIKTVQNFEKAESPRVSVYLPAVKVLLSSDVGVQGNKIQKTVIEFSGKLDSSCLFILKDSHGIQIYLKP